MTPRPRKRQSAEAKSTHEHFKRVVAAMSDAEVRATLERLGYRQPVRDTRSPIERMIDEATGYDAALRSRPRKAKKDRRK